MISDFHIHTEYSTDSQARLSDIMNQAMQMGMKSICITDHEDMHYNERHDFEIDLDEYYQFLNDQRKSYFAIELLIGIELGLQPQLSGEIEEFLARYPLDFVIGSTHVVNGQDPYYQEFWADRTSRQGLEDYFACVMNCLRSCGNFDVYGHLDYVTRYCPSDGYQYSWLDYQDLIDEILNILIFTGKGLELNTGGLYKGSQGLNPCVGILKRYRELGGEIITVGSDAHEADRIGYGFDQAEAILTDCGFSYYTIFRERHPRYVKI